MKYQKFKQFEQRAYSTVYSEQEGSFHDGCIKQLAEKFLPEISPDTGSKIIDIGCGPGIFMECAQGLGYENLVGVTLSKEDQRICKTKGFKTVCCSMTDLDIYDNTIDLIWCRHAIEHSPYPLFTLYEFHRVLNTLGKIFIEVPAPDNQRAFIHEYNPNHYSILGERMWDGLFEKSGFEVLSNFYYNQPVVNDGVEINEKSFIFILGKSKESLSSKFARKYGINI